MDNLLPFDGPATVLIFHSAQPLKLADIRRSLQVKGGNLYTPRGKVWRAHWLLTIAHRRTNPPAAQPKVKQAEYIFVSAGHINPTATFLQNFSNELLDGFHTDNENLGILLGLLQRLKAILQLRQQRVWSQLNDLEKEFQTLALDGRDEVTQASKSLLKTLDDSIGASMQTSESVIAYWYSENRWV